jgi:hypothetical protein
MKKIDFTQDILFYVKSKIRENICNIYLLYLCKKKDV